MDLLDIISRSGWSYIIRGHSSLLASQSRYVTLGNHRHYVMILTDSTTQAKQFLVNDSGMIYIV
jgi:hypothetical protein